MIEWEREDDGTDPKHAKLKPIKKYWLTPGKAGIYQDGVSILPNSMNFARTGRARPIYSMYLIRMSMRQGIFPVPYPHPAASWCRPPICMPARLVPASCLATTKRCAR
jgi:hypothetical protein